MVVNKNILDSTSNKSLIHNTYIFDTSIFIYPYIKNQSDS